MTQRILQGTAATLVYDHLDATGAAVDAAGTMTCEIRTADGTVVAPAGEPTVHPAAGRYTVNVLPDETADLTVLGVDWTDSAYPTVSHATEHEIVGGFLFSLADLRAWEAGRYASPSAFPDARVLEVRDFVEEEAAYICGRSFVPSYRRLVLDGTGTDTIATGIWFPNRVRTAKVLASAGSTSSTSLTAGQLAGIVASEDGQLRRTDGGVWDWGAGRIVLEVEHGSTSPSPSMRDAALIRAADLLSRPSSNVPARSRSWSQTDGFTFQLNPEDEFSTGIDAVDAVYARQSVRPRKDGHGRPVSRSWQLDPQWHAVFRGGVR